jgi:methyltransferase
VTSLGVVILAFVTAQRLFELWLANRNTKRLLAAGAVEHGAGHYPLVVALHASWLAVLWWLAPGQPVDPLWLVLFLLLQLGRLWVLATLGPRWTTRIIVPPEAPLVRAGPYRFVSHPNYWVVAGEIVALPLVFGLWPVAIVYSVSNAAVLVIRIRAEDRALGR